MRLHILSDIHDDYSRESVGNFRVPRDVEADVVVLAGDLAGRASRMGRSWLEAQRTGKPTICVLGNHDFWGGSLDTEIEKLRGKIVEPWIHVLDAEAVVIGDTRFVGATLWTDYEAHSPGFPEKGMRAALGGLNDWVNMRADAKARKAKPADVLIEHRRQLAAIERILATPFDGATVVVTHHAPSTRSLKDGRPTEALDGSYASRLDDVILRYEPELWIHGHLHSRLDYTVGRTRVVCNPRGYVHAARGGTMREESGFDERFVVDVKRHPRPAGRAVMKADVPAIDEDMRAFLDGKEAKFAVAPADEDGATSLSERERGREWAMPSSG